MRLFLVTLLCLMAIGCRSNPRVNRETALLRAEILDLEDKYYLLKSKYDGVISQLDEGQTTGESYYDGGIIYEGEINYGDGVPIQSGRSGGNLDNSTPRPDVSIPGNSDPLPSPIPDADGSSLLFNAPVTPGSSDIEVAMPQVINEAREITEIAIHRATTRGRDVDEIPGDDGVDLLVQPLTADGHVELQAGELTISVIDKAETPDRQRIGLWKFVPEETKLFFANDELDNRGILLHLPWDQSTPVNEDLELHVRFVSNEGPPLETSGTLRIHPPARGYSAKAPEVVKWTREDSRWIPAPDGLTKFSDGSPWREPRISSNRSVGSPTGPLTSPTSPAIPAKSPNQRPVWRPIR